MRSNFIWSNMAHIAIGNHHGQTLLVCWVKGIDCVGPPRYRSRMTYIDLEEPTDMCGVYKPHKGDMLDQNTRPPIPCMRPEKNVWVWCVICSNPESTSSMGHQLHQ